MQYSQGWRPPEPVTREEERQELAAILAHPEIARSANMVRMLTFICDKYFADRIEDIRESCIAIQALGRRASSFDSQSDPIVRVTARMLRKRLDAFYCKTGSTRTIRLELPLGRYVPRFVRVEQAPHYPAAVILQGCDASGTLDGATPQAALHDSGVAEAPKESMPTDSAIVAGGDMRRPSGRMILLMLTAAAVFIAACVFSFLLGRRSVPTDAAVMVETATCSEGTFVAAPWSGTE